MQRILLTALLVTAAALASADSGEELAFRYRCATCHGVDGMSADARYPHLAGQKEAYIASRLRAFRSGFHPYNQMNSQAGSLSDDDIATLARYYSSKEAF